MYLCFFIRKGIERKALTNNQKVLHDCIHCVSPRYSFLNCVLYCLIIFLVYVLLLILVRVYWCCTVILICVVHYINVCNCSSLKNVCTCSSGTHGSSLYLFREYMTIEFLYSRTLSLRVLQCIDCNNQRLPLLF